MNTPSHKAEQLAVRLASPVLLQAENFTPLSRTPWAGQRLALSYKEQVLTSPATARIGEAWEFSCDMALPSRLADGSCSLAELIALDPEAALSPAQARRTAGKAEILLKLLDTAEPLSLQVHPSDGDLALQPGECGKPESWLVLAAEPGAGIYMGFVRPFSRSALRTVLADDSRARDALFFVPVQPGDYFEIEAGVPHAIGAGVTLLEPQRVVAGQSGKTFRLWDWGRRYDDRGLPDARGRPRELHLDTALPLIDPERQVGEAFVATLRRSPQLVERNLLTGRLKAYIYPSNPHYQTLLFELPAGGQLDLVIRDGYAALVILTGGLDAGGATVPKGQPVFLPHAAMPVSMKALPATSGCSFALVVPAGAHVDF